MRFVTEGKPSKFSLKKYLIGIKMTSAATKLYLGQYEEDDCITNWRDYR